MRQQHTHTCKQQKKLVDRNDSSVHAVSAWPKVAATAYSFAQVTGRQMHVLIHRHEDGSLQVQISPGGLAATPCFRESAIKRYYGKVLGDACTMRKS